MSAQAAPAHAQGGTISSVGAHFLALWLGVLLPIATAIQLTYSATYFAKLSQPVVAGLAFLLMAMIALGLRAAFAIWAGRQIAPRLAEQALLASVGANMLACAPLSILMSAPPTFLPVVLVSLLCFALSDRWNGA